MPHTNNTARVVHNHRFTMKIYCFERAPHIVEHLLQLCCAKQTLRSRSHDCIVYMFGVKHKMICEAANWYVDFLFFFLFQSCGTGNYLRGVEIY